MWTAGTVRDFERRALVLWKRTRTDGTSYGTEIQNLLEGITESKVVVAARTRPRFFFFAA